MASCLFRKGGRGFQEETCQEGFRRGKRIHRICDALQGRDRKKRLGGYVQEHGAGEKSPGEGILCQSRQ